MSRVTSNRITQLNPNEVFVFGSNLQGIHGFGAALQALRWGAVKHQGIGPMGWTYGIPTKYTPWRVLPLRDIELFVNNFINYTDRYLERKFLVTEIGCGLAGYTPVDIAPMFEHAVNRHNIYLLASFYKILTNEKHL
jgi:hypothetical protein